MANTFSKVDWVTMETLRLFKHSCGVFSMMRHDHEEDFKKPFAVGDTIRVKFPWRPVIRDGFKYQGGNIERIETTIKVDQPFGVDFEWDTVDKLLNMERGEEKVRKEYALPAAQRLAAEADVRAARFAARHTSNITGVLGTDPSTFAATSGAARQRFVELSTMSGDRGIYVPPSVMTAIKSGSDANLSRFGIPDAVKKLYRDGLVGYEGGFEWEESMSLYEHTAGTWNTANTLASAVANGASELSITCTSGDTCLEGDKIGLTGIYRVNPVNKVVTERTNVMTVSVSQSVTASGSTATVPINQKLYYTGNYQNISAQPSVSGGVTLFPGTSSPSGKVGKIGLAFTREAFAGISLPLPMPKNEEVQSIQTDPETGISIAFIRSFDAVERRWINRFDVLLAFGDLHVELASMAILCK